MKDETLIFQFTEKGKQLNESIEDAFGKWLELSELTKEELLTYKNVKGFHIVDTEEGYILAYCEDGIEKHIGAGLEKDSLDAAFWIFGYICALFDGGNEYKSEFSKEYLKWGAVHGKR